MDKIVRDGKIAVLIAPEYGGGWSTWNDPSYSDVLLFHPELVSLVEEGRSGEITEELCQKLLGLNKGDYVCVLATDDLVIEWLPQGTRFEVEEYDGFESIRIMDNVEFKIA